MSFIHTLHIRIGESGITQAISKRITRFPFKVAVSTSKHRIVLERRQIIVTFIGCQRHASCRIAMPKEHIDNGISRCLSAIPCLKQRIGILAFPLKTHYRARHIDYNQRTSGFLQFFQQLNLHQGKLHSGAVSAGKPSIACCSGISGFTFIIGTYTTHKNNNVRLRGFMSYLYEWRSILQFIHDTYSRQIINFNLIAQASLQTHIRSNDFRRSPEIISQLGLPVIGIGPNQGYALYLWSIKRQNVILILQQDDRFLSHALRMLLMRFAFQDFPSDGAVGHSFCRVEHTYLK